MLDVRRYHKLNHPLIIPSVNILTEFGESLEKLEVFEYGLSLQEESFHIGPTGCILRWPLAFAYALSVITQAEAKSIHVVGFDGYSTSDPMQQEMNQVITSYYKLTNCLPIKSLTPTTYNIPQGSIFEPMIEMTNFVVVIPARYASTRFPGKPLADLCGKSLIRHVWEKCAEAVGEQSVVVATDNKVIQDHCLEQGMQVVMTSSSCLTGTDRVYEVAKQFKRDIYINVQGDEPLIRSHDITTVIQAALKHQGNIINGMCPINNEEDFRSPNVPKVVATSSGTLLYMSRAPVPTSKKHKFHSAMRQVCIYAFPRDAILDFGHQREKTPLEKIEDIEILRFLEMGYSVKMVEVVGSPVAVDTPEDLERAKAMMN